MFSGETAASNFTKCSEDIPELWLHFATSFSSLILYAYAYTIKLSLSNKMKFSLDVTEFGIPVAHCKSIKEVEYY